MRLIPKRRPADRTPRSIEKTFPAPVGGWNARDSFAAMPATDAIQLDNWYPRPSYVETRGGYTMFASNLPADVKTLAVGIRKNGFSALLVFFDTGVRIVSLPGDYTGTGIDLGNRTVGRHQWVQFGDGTNSWVIAVNGADKPLYYNVETGGYVQVDGTTSPAITGLTTTELIGVQVFKNRLLFIRKDKLGFDYLPANAAGGAASYYDLTAFASKGGYLMAIAVWSRDAGNGPDDYAVFITSEGEAMVYSGTDPSNANSWALVGTFRIGRPLGRKCVTKYGADPLILVEDGLFPLSALLTSGDERQKFALSFKIQDAFSQAATKYFNNIGWQVVSFPGQDAIVVNVPIQQDGRHDQYVMNTISKAWCRFTGLDAEEFIIHKVQIGQGPGQLLFSKGRQIFQMWSGTSDHGSPIVATARQAPQDFGTPYIKEPLMFMPVFTSTSLSSYSAGIDTDFAERASQSVSLVPPSRAGRWGVTKWGFGRWGGASGTVRQWGSVATWPGRWLSGTLKIASTSTAAKWIGSVMRFNVGSGL